MRTLFPLAPAVACLILCGCGSKVNMTMTGRVELDKPYTVVIDAPKKDQQVDIAFESDEEVNVFGMLEKDFSDSVEGVLQGAGPSTPLPTGDSRPRHEGEKGGVDAQRAGEAKGARLRHADEQGDEGDAHGQERVTTTSATNASGKSTNSLQPD